MSFIYALNNDLTAVYDKTDGKWYERNADGTRGTEIKVGGNMMVLKTGTITSTTTISLGVTLSTSKYIVILDTSAYTRQFDSGVSGFTIYGYGKGAYVSSRTTSSVKIEVTSGITCSYQIVQIAE